MTNAPNTDGETRRRIANLAIPPIEVSEPVHSAASTIWDDIGISYLARIVLKYRKLLWLVPILWLVFSNLGFIVSGRTYSAELQVVPATLNGEIGHSNALGALGSMGFGSLLGQLANDDLFSVYLESWTAPWFAEALASNELLMKRIFPDQWSNRVQDWRDPQSPKAALKSIIYPLFGGQVKNWTPPGAEDVLKYLQKNIAIQHNSRNVLVHITLRGRDRVLASDILQYGHTLINRRTAEILYARAVKSSEYLTQKLSQAMTADIRQSLINELTTQERTQMLAFADTEFAAQSFGVFTKPSPIAPKGAVIIGLALFVSGLAVLGLMLLVDRGMVPEPRLGAVASWPYRRVAMFFKRKGQPR